MMFNEETMRKKKPRGIGHRGASISPLFFFVYRAIRT
jgi:hypothetical protein